MSDGPTDQQTIDEWWNSLESWSQDAHGNRIPNRGLCETPSVESVSRRRVYETRPATAAEIKSSKLK